MGISATLPPTDTIPHSVQWIESDFGFLRLLDQTRLPSETHWLDCHTVSVVDEAIRQLRVRGAPAIGIAAAYGVCVAAIEHRTDSDIVLAIENAIERLAASRPTAVNLFWALDRMRQVLIKEKRDGAIDFQSLLASLLQEARRIHEEDRAMCHAIGRYGASLLADGSGVITHCNAGGLATAEYGTALSAIFTAQDQGKQLHVYVDETRPLLQGARLTAWELTQRKVPCTLICDSMAAQVMKEGKIQAVIVGADRITARGDAANKIGTYGLAILARYHAIPFYVAAPSSTFDLALEHGSDIPIEQRSAVEITDGFGKRTAPHDVAVYNPAFDVTPAELIAGIVTEKGIVTPVNRDRIREVLGSNLPGN